MAMDAHLAARAVAFVKALRHTKGEWYGMPFQLQKWQESALRELFGRTDAKGVRQYRKAYFELPRKNGKSEMAAAIALYMLFADGEKGAEIYSAAADREQASLVFNAAAAMVRQSPALSKVCKIVDSQKRIIYYKNSSFYRAISAEAATKHGFNAHAVIYDELHCAPNRELWDTLMTSMGARRQPLMMAITTAGCDRHSICWELHDYAVKVARGMIKDPSFFPLVYSADEDEDWTSKRVWKKANPNYGRSLKPEYLETAFKQAQETPAFENSFRRLHLNQWTSQETRWLPMAEWDACPSDRIDPESLIEEPCFMGVDLSETSDLSSVNVFFPAVGVTLSYNWIPADLVELKERTDRVPYMEWIRAGYVAATPGNVTDYDFLKETIMKLAESFKGLRFIGYDRWKAVQMMIQLEKEGLPVVPVAMGFQTLSPACKEVERLVRNGALRHQGNPLMRWAAENVTVKSDENENIRPVKSDAGGRIDPLMALIIAVAAMQKTEGLDGGPSVYESRGLLTI